ncbi:MAG TPA: carboxypeptidase regulatory-like domain-containing protein, partial [Planctomycetes bacterium]|nr:carboxypeptidase regulatory-like domain-containing protein [Planctomycetota bacterium]
MKYRHRLPWIVLLLALMAVVLVVRDFLGTAPERIDEVTSPAGTAGDPKAKVRRTPSEKEARSQPVEKTSTPAPPSRPQTPLYGIVVDSTDTPVAAASLELIENRVKGTHMSRPDQRGIWDTLRTRTMAQTHSGDDGRFAFDIADEGRFTLVARHPRLGDSRVFVQIPRPQPLRVVLRLGRRLPGRVIDRATDVGIPGATISGLVGVQDGKGGFDMVGVLKAVSGEDGSFDFPLPDIGRNHSLT